MTKEQIVQLAVDNDLVEEVYGTLHFIIMAELENIRDRSDKLNSELRLIKIFAAANKLDVIKDILSEEMVESEIHCNCTDAEIAKSFIEDVEAVKDLLPQESDHKCHTCKHYTSGEHDGSCGSYICKGYSNWESEV